MADTETTEAESPTDNNNGGNNSNPNLGFPNLGRQSSIYTLTLDEFQHTVCENHGKNFGSMNMDEFLNNIWTAEENQTSNNQLIPSVTSSNLTGRVTLSKQASLPRQGSLSLPGPLCRKTVDEVWSEIQKTQHLPRQRKDEGGVGNYDSTPRQPTFGEMTLEDFLIKAGVVREQCGPAVQRITSPPVNQFGFGTPLMGAHTFVGRSGGQGYGAPVSPVSQNGICGPGQVDNPGGGQYGIDLAALRGRRRVVDGPVEMVVERRQRRMIKNRESAARSRARKQAYTVELEAELNQLKEENTHLKESLAVIERQRKQQCSEERKVVVLTKAQRAQQTLKRMRRSGSSSV